jgi:WD40 repeat protein
MPIATRTFRVFVSSTFEDLKEERDALQRDVFPKLRRLCEQHGARFQAIDLRWGVRDEAALDQQTMEICLREIERCQRTGVKPNFIVLLGDRYGWRPLPSRIPASEFDAFRAHILAGEAEALANHWYKLDENAVPPEYCIQPRTGEFVSPAAWNPVEQALHQALAQAVRAAGLPETELVKYEASATHQEILAGLGKTEADRQHVFGFFRRTSGETDARLEDLKAYLRTRLPGNIVEFDPGDIARLCDAVFAHLQDVIELEVKRFEDRSALDLEVEAHDRFAEEHSRIFTGRQAVLETIAGYLRGPERRPLVLHGESGSGKSAVMAKASQQYRGPGRVIRRFIGASPQSASGHALLTSLCREIAPPTTSDVTPVDYAQLENAFKERLKVASAGQPLVIFIDALDQLAASDPARDVTWLPPELPPHVKVIVSISVSGTGDGERLPEGVPVRLERMAQSEGEQALDELLREARRNLQPWQQETVLAHFERCGLPLYLKLAADESRLWRSFAPENACKLGEGVAGVIDTLFDRLSTNANHGPVLVGRSLGYLAAARYGLAEDEILDVLTEDDAVWNDFDKRKHHEVSERRLPVVVWSRLSLDLEPYLTERAAPGGTVIAFYHRQLAERVEAKFLAGDEAQSRHADLAMHFLAATAWLDEGQITPNARRAAELVFQQWQARQWPEAEATLFDCSFLFAKVAASMVLDLDSDYRAVLADAPTDSLKDRAAVKLIHGALRLSVHVVVHDSRQFASQMVGRLLPHKEKPVISLFIDEITRSAPRPWLRPVHSALQPPGGPLIRTLEGHSSWVTGVAVYAKGSRAVSASLDETLRVWDVESGRVLQILEGHSDGVKAVAVTPDGRRAVSASDDKTLRVWGLATGTEVLALNGHKESVNCVAITPDGRYAVSGSSDKTLKMWDLANGIEVLVLSGHKGSINCVAITPDGRFAVSGSEDDTLMVWDLSIGLEVRSLIGQSDPVSCVAVTPDGGFAVAGAFAPTWKPFYSLKIWNLTTGNEVRPLVGHEGFVHCVAITCDGRFVLSGGQDHTLRVWEPTAGKESRLIDERTDTDEVTCIAISPDVHLAVSGTKEGVLRVWDLDVVTESRSEAGRIEPVEWGAITPDERLSMDEEVKQTLDLLVTETKSRPHIQPVGCVAITPDGRLAVSGSGWDYRPGQQALQVWDLATGSILQSVEIGVAPVTCIAITRDGRFTISGTMMGAIELREIATGRVMRKLAEFEEMPACLGITPDARVVICGADDNILRVREVATGRLIRSLVGHTARVTCVAITPDGHFAVSGSEDKMLRVWDLKDGGVLQTLVGHSEAVKAVAVYADGRRAISASRDKTLKTWDLATGREIRTLGGRTHGFDCVEVTLDGRFAISSSVDRILEVWELSGGLPLASFFFDADVVGCVATPDCKGIVVGVGNFVARLDFEDSATP